MLPGLERLGYHVRRYRDGSSGDRRPQTDARRLRACPHLPARRRRRHGGAALPRRARRGSGRAEPQLAARRGAQSPGPRPGSGAAAPARTGRAAGLRQGPRGTRPQPAPAGTHGGRDRQPEARARAGPEAAVRAARARERARGIGPRRRGGTAHAGVPARRPVPRMAGEGGGTAPHREAGGCRGHLPGDPAARPEEPRGAAAARADRDAVRALRPGRAVPEARGRDRAGFPRRLGRPLAGAARAARPRVRAREHRARRGDEPALGERAAAPRKRAGPLGAARGSGRDVSPCGRASTPRRRRPGPGSATR